MKIATIIGARPQFIKAAMVSRVLRNRQGVREILIHTGQHYDNNMSDVFFNELEIPAPDYNLGISADTQGAQTGRMLEAIEAVLITEKPDCVLVYGDTNSTLAGALAAVKLHIPVAHVEAGLRSFNRKMPEEHNRVLTDHCSKILFCPTQNAVDNLQAEGIISSAQYVTSLSANQLPRTVALVGDVMYDAALFFGDKAKRESHILEDLNLETKTYILATVHRAENTDNPARLMEIFKALDTVAGDIPVILPLHPRTRKKLGDIKFSPSNLNLIPPLGYLDMVLLEKNARLIVTDSGGIQKEAFFHKVPCVTLREETEWVELVEAGVNVLVGADKDRIMQGIDRMMKKKIDSNLVVYGRGDAGKRVVEALAL
ncbi:MAG: UDP-N-acetylglucosamine 2-epimerase (non-hydrolyzing) [Acidobacteriota bacterium]|nr:UDP-N-acetylglucosamine 2-epimerase (non-hydrolyzing) [Acidobacteriota bacterium]